MDVGLFHAEPMRGREDGVEEEGDARCLVAFEGRLETAFEASSKRFATKWLILPFQLGSRRSQNRFALRSTLHSKNKNKRKICGWAGRKNKKQYSLGR